MSKGAKKKSRKNLIPDELQKHVSTQTEIVKDDKDNTEVKIAHLLEQVRLLEIENWSLKNPATEKPSNDPKASMSAEFAQTIGKIKDEDETEDVTENNETLPFGDNNVSRRVIKAAIRGCSCKGNCSNKICGCVKKGQICGEGCKCNNVSCQNQAESSHEADKENVENTMQTESNNSINPSHTTVASEAMHIPVPRVQRVKDKNSKAARSDVADKENLINTMQTEDNKSIKNKHLETVKRSKGLFSPCDDGRSSMNFIPENYCTEPLCFDTPKALSFSSDGEIEDKDAIGNVKKSKIHQKNANMEKRGGRNKEKSHKLTTRSNKTYRSSSNEERRKTYLLQIDEPTLRKSVSTEIQVGKDNKSGPINVTKRKITNRDVLKRTDKTEITSTFKAEENTQSETEFYTTCFDSQKFNESGSSEDNSFDPTKPKHQLLRTPPRSSSERSPDTPQVAEHSFVGFTTIAKATQPIPAEFYQPQVDWKEHKAQLVACKACNRKFHPLRVKTHELCCKRISPLPHAMP